MTDCIFKSIIKRNGVIVPFKSDLITDAIFKAALAVGGTDRKIAEQLTEKAILLLNEMYPAGATPSVEDVQDTVEKVLIENGHAKTAKAYIIYRARHSELRQQRDESIVASDNIPYKKIWQVLNWNIDHDCHSVAAINRHIKEGTFPELVQKSCKAYENDIAKAASRIIKFKNQVRLVIIAGPSSSGKTTTTIKLEEYLKKEGLELVAMQLDNYFWDLEMHPKDEFGDYDYETPQALDLELINGHLSDLLKGKTIQVPRYNFKTGKREKETDPMQIKDNQLILIDSLHGLYGDMTKSISPDAKFKVYIETLAQQKGADREFIRWADIRLLRRMVRDSWHRNSDPRKTLEHWHYVRRSELKNIIPFLNTVDYIINGALPFELPVHKKYLFKHFPDFVKDYKDNPKRQDAYIRAKRVHDLLNSVMEIPDESIIPEDSLMREYIGGSIYEY